MSAVSETMACLGDAGGLFVTGTDTGVGKTVVSLALMALLQAKGYSVAAMKPVASGCTRHSGRLVNDDARRLQVQADPALPYDDVNPYAFEPAIAPHLAAAEVARPIALEVIAGAYTRLSDRADLTVVEGVGGWLVPLNGRQTVADLALRLGLPVLLVVGIRLGCLNHALLSARSIDGHGTRLAGWVANHVAPDTERAAENVASLQARIEAPLLGEVPWRPGASPRQMAAYLSCESAKRASA